MSKGGIGTALIVLGLVLSLAALAADALGVGGYPGIGWKQWLGIGAGLVIVVAGLFVFFQGRGKSAS